MVGHKDRAETADADRRRFLGLAAKLGLAVPPVVTLALTRPAYAAGSSLRPGSLATPGSLPVALENRSSRDFTI